MIKHCDLPPPSNNALDVHRRKLVYAQILDDPVHSRDVLLSNLLIDMYGKCRHADRALLVFQSTAFRNIFSWDIIVSALARNDHLQAALFFFARMPRIGSVAATAMVIALAEAGHLSDAEVLFESMPDKDTTAKNAMISMYGRIGDIRRAESIFADVQEPDEGHDPGLFPGRASGIRDAHLSGHVTAKLLLLEHDNEFACIAWGDGECVGDFLQDAGAQLGVVHDYARGICRRDGNLVRAVEVLDSMPRRNVRSWNVMLDACGEVDEARSVFCRMPYWDGVTWNSMIIVLAQGDDPCDENIALDTTLWKIPQHGIFVQQLLECEILFRNAPERSVTTWTAMISAFAECGDLQTAGAFFSRMPAWNAVPWNILVQANATGGDLERAKALYDLAPVRTVTGANVLLGAYASSGEMGHAWRIFDRMPQWDNATWTSLVTAYAEAGSVEMCEELFQRLPQRDVFAWAVLIQVHHENCQFAKAKSIFDAIPYRNSVCCNLMIAAHILPDPQLLLRVSIKVWNLLSRWLATGRVHESHLHPLRPVAV